MVHNQNKIQKIFHCRNNAYTQFPLYGLDTYTVVQTGLYLLSQVAKDLLGTLPPTVKFDGTLPIVHKLLVLRDVVQMGLTLEFI